MTHLNLSKRSLLLAVASSLVFLSGCHQDMWNQPKVEPYSPSRFFANNSGMLLPPANTVDRTHFWTDEGRYLGYKNVKVENGRIVKADMVTRFPFAIHLEDLKRGQKEYDIFCTPCHGVLGNGVGMIALRGLVLRRAPASYHTKRLRKMPIGHFYDVITNGFGAMFPYGARIEPDDRWRIVAYIRVLQRSQDAKPSDIPPGINVNTLPRIHTTGESDKYWQHNERQIYTISPQGSGSVGSNGGAAR